MKLLSLYIENFGCLHRYSLRFEDGLTAIEAPNGSGKTTLAEFIRAMFYGMPRKSKFLNKNPREKYLPWQGGTYGGSLTFEHLGQIYKAERTFGAAPKQDSFVLYDEQTHRKSPAFSEHLGEELFQLDSDSFERSTYLPQMGDSGPLTTDNIQAKLSDLIDDSNDVGNYEKALAALKNQRSSLIPYRGDGGSVARAQGEISRIQTDLSRLSSVPEDLDAARIRLSQLKARQKSLTAQREDTRKAITAASSAAARKSLLEQMAGQQEKILQLSKTRQELSQVFPGGVPENSLFSQTEDLFLSHLPQDTPEEEALLKARARWEALSPVFSSGVPGDQEISRAKEESRRLIAAQGALSQLDFPEEQELLSLQAFFAPGIPEDLNGLSETLKEYDRLALQRRSLAPDPRELHEYEQLQKNLPLPTFEDIQAQQEKLRKAAELRQADPQPSGVRPENSKKPRGLSPLPFLIVSILSLAAGAALLFCKQLIPGAGGLILGFLLLIAAVYLKLRQEMRRELGGSVSPDPQQQDREQQALRLQTEVMTFLSAYPGEEQSPGLRLLSLEETLHRYECLHEKFSQADRESQTLNKELQALETRLYEGVSPYFEDPRPYDAHITLLKEKLSRCVLLSRRKQELSGRGTALKERVSALSESLGSFLAPYDLGADPENFDRDLQTLEQQAQQFVSARETLNAHALRIQQAAQAADAARETFRRLWEPYGLPLRFGDLSTLRNLREQAKTLSSLDDRLAEEKNALNAFREAHQTELSSPVLSEVPDLSQLKERETALHQELSQLETQIADQAGVVRSLQQQAEDLPALQDGLLTWQGILARDREKAHVLDETMDYLARARESLSHSYMGKITSAFGYYLKQLTDVAPELTAVTSDLQIRVDRQGKSRSLSYFSAGQADLLMLCMRLALVDTLFAGQQPLLILDDPFINLDDVHTEKALQLLKNLSSDHQILYLYCNSSRKLH